MMKNRWILASPGLLLAAFAHNAAGGWAVTSVQDVPDYAVAGQPLTLTYAVRQHGEELHGDLNGTVSARSGTSSVSVDAKAASQRGYYTATLTLPNAGDWTITIASGFPKSHLKLLPIRAVAVGAPAPRALAPDERGRQLFVAKGCVTCHTHSDSKAEVAGPDGPPDLTDKTFAPTYLAEFLANPKIKPAANKNGWQMPNQQLKQAEIAALVAFINSDRRVASR
jgi:mono/diheme cytochrome c family protein